MVQRLWVAASIMIATGALATAGCGASCEDALRNMARIMSPGQPIPKEELKVAVEQCERSNVPKSTRNCLADASDRAALEKCGFEVD